MNEIKPTTDVSAARRQARPAGHPPVRCGRIGVLLLNLGTPDGTDYWSMRRYLKEFLSDERVIEVPRWKWWPILNLIILTVRPGRKGKDYATIWNNERNEGPLKTITRAQAEKLRAALGMPERVEVDFAMRYANPTTDSRIRALQEQGCDRILLVPLYPQYAAATTATAADHAFRTLMQMRWQPAVRVAPSYHDDPVYIDALADSMRRQLAELDFDARGHHRDLPRHAAGIPRSRATPITASARRRRGCCVRHWAGRRTLAHDVSVALRLRSLAAALHRRDREAARREGVKRLALVAPGFSADCLETLEELDGENRHYFEAGGGEKFAYLPALNDSDEGMRVIEAVVRRELQGWL